MPITYGKRSKKWSNIFKATIETPFTVMSGNIYITSFEALQRFDTVLGIFSEDVSDKIQYIGKNMENHLVRLEDFCQELEREINYWDSECEQADIEEEDIAYLAYKREEIEEKLRHVRNLQRQAEEAAENFARCARRVSAIADERINEARGFLRQKIRELQGYNSVQLDIGEYNVESSIAGLFSSSVNFDAFDIKIEERIENAEGDWLKIKGSERTRFSLLFGKFAHERYQEKIREFESLNNRKERKNLQEQGDYGIEFPLKHPDGENVYYDYVDFTENTIIDYKSVKEGQSEEDVFKDKEIAKQRKRHIEAYEFNFGLTPTYRYETYQSTVNLYLKKK